MRAAWAVAVLAALPAALPAATVPFVGCPSDGQLGPRAAPAATEPDAARAPDVAGAAAARLAWYAAADGTGVLAPRGWRCFGTYGSNGSVLVVAPRPLGWKVVTGRRGLDGPAVQLEALIGDTAGRFEVAPIAAQLFPAARGYVREFEAEHNGGRRLPDRPVATDRVARLSDAIVRYTTPAGHQGLGTASHLRAGPLPIEGAAVLDMADDMSLTMIHVRLMRPDHGLAAVIVDQMVPLPKLPPAWPMP